MKKQLSAFCLSTGLFCVTTALMSGCATEPPPVSAEDLAKAAETVLNQSVYTTQLFSSCIELGGDIKNEAIDLQLRWENTNSALVNAADSFYSVQLGNQIFELDGKKVAPSAIRLVQDASSKAINELALATRSPVNKPKTCQFRFLRLKEKEFQLAKHPEIAPYQAELLTYQNRNSFNAKVAAPNLAAGINQVAEGQTFYTVSQAHEKTCKDAYTLPIKNQWPVEVYVNFCGADPKEVLSCEWGKCTAKK